MGGYFRKKNFAYIYTVYIIAHMVGMHYRSIPKNESNFRGGGGGGVCNAIYYKKHSNFH
jgi:hypothetical protein